MRRFNHTFLVLSALALLTTVSGFLHVFRISQPPVLVEDESHFATYAAHYASRTGFYDIHPPLGRLILGAAARLAGVTTPYPFIKILPWNSGRMFEQVVTAPLGDFPYQTLRLTVAAAGALIPAGVFLLLFSLGAGNATALLGAFFVTFENMLLLHSRLIMLDAFFILFGILGLALFFLKDRFPQKSFLRQGMFVLGALLLGAAGAVKLSGFMFAVGLFAALALSRELRKRHAPARTMQKLLALLVLPIIAAFTAHQVILGTDAQLAFWKYIFPEQHINTFAAYLFPSSSFLQGAVIITSIRMLEGMFSIGAYLGGFKLEGISQAVAAEGGPLAWLIMWKSGIYAEHSARVLMALGNPVVWAGATLALLHTASLALKRITLDSGQLVLFSVFLTNFFLFFPPWFTARPISVFHYAPAFTIAIALCAYTLKPIVDKAVLGSKRHWLYLMSLAITILVGFALIIPATYYLALT